MIGYWAPLAYLYVSSSSGMLASRHPESTIEESLGFMYCPNCLTRFQSEEVKDVGYRCPTCLSCPKCLSVVVLRAVGDSKMDYHCGYCDWSSECTGVFGGTRAELDEALRSKEQEGIGYSQSAFHALLTAYRSADTQLLTNRESRVATKKQDLSDYFFLTGSEDFASKAGGSSLRVCDLDEEIVRRAIHKPLDPQIDSPLCVFVKAHAGEEQQSAFLDTLVAQSCANNLLSVRQRNFPSVPGSNILSSNAIPIRMELLSKRTLRCRRDVEEGKLSILLQPKTLPLEGDSSQKLQKGKWFLKDGYYYFHYILFS